jgi:hypothetical protein
MALGLDSIIQDVNFIIRTVIVGIYAHQVLYTALEWVITTAHIQYRLGF